MTDAFYDSHQWLALRYRALKSSNGCCQLCGAFGTPQRPLHVDHIKPRSKFPELALVESNLQVLCSACNLGKSNKDATNWKMNASSGLIASINRKTEILASLEPDMKAKLEQLSWLKQNDTSPQIRREADKQYSELWRAIEAGYNAREA